MDWAVAMLAVASVLVSFGSTPHLVELGSVVFAGFSLKLVSCWFFLSGFPYKPDTWVSCLHWFSASFPYKLTISFSS
jgi:hypothetical protein